MVRHNGKSSGINPDPWIFLEGFRGIEGPYLSTSHFHGPKICVNIITGLCVYVTEIMGQLGCTGPWMAPVQRVLHVIIGDNIPAFSINVHPILVEGPRVEFLGVLITALLPVNLDVVIFCNVGFFVRRTVVPTVSLCFMPANGWAHLLMPSQWACFQHYLITNPLCHGCQSGSRRGRGLLENQVHVRAKKKKKK